MRIHIEDASVTVENEQDLRTLSAVTRLSGAALSSAMSRGSLGGPDPDGRHVWLEPSALRVLVHADDGWSLRFDAMLRFAADHAFTDAGGRIRAHIEQSAD